MSSPLVRALKLQDQSAEAARATEVLENVLATDLNPERSAVVLERVQIIIDDKIVNRLNGLRHDVHGGNCRRAASPVKL